jgi:hypothetical protein
MRDRIQIFGRISEAGRRGRSVCGRARRSYARAGAEFQILDARGARGKSGRNIDGRTPSERAPARRIRRDADTAGTPVELTTCQRVSDLTLLFPPVKVR